MNAHVCIGGPLNGLHATTKDFQPGMQRVKYPPVMLAPKKDAPFDGMYDLPPITSTPAGRYAHLRNEYQRFNSGIRGSRCSMVWIHHSMLKPSVPAGK